MPRSTHHPSAGDAASRRASAQDADRTRAGPGGSDRGLVEALETGAGALLALEALRANVELLGEPTVVGESIDRAIALVRAALDELHPGLGGQLALGFVAGARRDPDEPGAPSRADG